MFHSHEEEITLTFGSKGAYIFDLDKGSKITYGGLWGIIGLLKKAKIH